MTLSEIRKQLRALGNNKRADAQKRYFKTGPGEYGEGDIFLGVRVPELRKLAKMCPDAGEQTLDRLLQSSVHEERFLALLMMVRAFAGGTDRDRKRIYDLYLARVQWINNWDLVDVSAEHIVGGFLRDRSKEPLYELARSENLWERRISIMSTFHFIKRNLFSETLAIATILLSDREDLIHKAVGWMLREVGKRDLKTEEDFIKHHYDRMPRTTLRYAIEKFPEPKRRRYLKGTFTPGHP